MPNDRITHKDILGNDVYLDSKSLGLAIVSQELRSHVPNLIKKCIVNPAVIIQLTEKDRLYLTGSNVGFFHLSVASIILKDSEWYVDSHYLEQDRSKMMELMKHPGIIFTRP